MARFIVRYTGKGDLPEDAQRRMADAKGVRVVDKTSRMLLVEGEEGVVRASVQPMAEFVVSPEQTIPLPDTRPKVKRKP